MIDYKELKKNERYIKPGLKVQSATDKNVTFEVINLDEKSRTVDIEFNDGTVEKVDSISIVVAIWKAGCKVIGMPKKCPNCGKDFIETGKLGLMFFNDFPCKECCAKKGN